MGKVVTPDGYDGWPMIIPQDDGVEVNNLYFDMLLGVVSPSEWYCLMWLTSRCAKERQHHIEAALSDIAGDQGMHLGLNTTRKAFKGLQEWGVVSIEPLAYGIYRWRLTAYADWNLERIKERQDASESKVQDRRDIEALRNGAQWRQLRLQVFERDGYRCTYCGAPGKASDLECDHILPLQRGGANELSNLATACHSCNRSKGARTPEEWQS